MTHSLFPMFRILARIAARQNFVRQWVLIMLLLLTGKRFADSMLVIPPEHYRRCKGSKLLLRHDDKNKSWREDFLMHRCLESKND